MNRSNRVLIAGAMFLSTGWFSGSTALALEVDVLAPLMAVDCTLSFKEFELVGANGANYCYAEGLHSLNECLQRPGVPIAGERGLVSKEQQCTLEADAQFCRCVKNLMAKLPPKLL